MPQPESFAKCSCQHCGGHLEFPAHAAGQKITCPHCNWPTVLALPQTSSAESGGARGGSKRIYLSLAITALLLGGAMAAHFYLRSSRARQEVSTPMRPAQASNVTSAAVSTNPAPTAMRKLPADPWHGLKPSKVTLEKKDESSLIYAIGSLTNDTTRQRFGVKIELDVLDAHRNKLGSATDYTEVIEPGKEWKFRALVTAKAAVGAKLVKVKEQE